MAEIKSRQPATERVVSYISSSEGFWKIPTEKGIWQLSGKLIPAMTQDESAEYRSENGFHALSVPEVFDIMGSMYDLRNSAGEIEGAMDFLNQVMRKNYLSTQTRVIYTPNGKDRIIHGYGAESAVEKKVNLIGPNGLVADVLSATASRALTGKTPKQVSELMGYINGVPAYVWRVNSKPKLDDERVVRLNAGFDWAYLHANMNPRSAYSWLGGKFSREAPK